MVLVEDEEQSIQLTWKSCTNFASGFVYLEDSVTIIMDLTKFNIIGQPYLSCIGYRENMVAY